MSIADLENDIRAIKEKLEQAEQEPAPKPKKPLTFRLPGRVKSKAKKAKKEGKHLCIILKNNMSLDFQWLKDEGGIIQYGKYKFCGFDPSAVYNYNNKYPVVLIPEWRLSPVGGIVEQAEVDNITFGGAADKDRVAMMNIGEAGQQTIIRAIEKAEVDKLDKKKGNWGWLIWVGVGLVVLYVVAKLMGWIK